ncbi:MAG: hypothetical protein FWJ93_08630, partial [Micromonosporaceae bacterium]
MAARVARGVFSSSSFSGFVSVPVGVSCVDRVAGFCRPLKGVLIMTMFKRWLDAITDTAIGRKLVVGAAGVALTGGVAAGPAVAAIDTTPPVTPATVAAAVTAEQPADKPADKPVKDKSAKPVKDKSAKPAKDKLVPHGVQGTQSHVALTDE